MNLRTTCIRSTLLLATFAMAGLGLNQNTLAYPEPAVVTGSWQFDISIKQPRVIQVQLPTAAQPRLYWYLPYTVTNNTGNERLWVPQVSVFTSSGEVLTAGKGISPIVFNSIREALRNELLESPIDVVGKLLQGRDNARDSVFIWPVSDLDVDSFRVFIGGLSGETALVTNPQSGDSELLRKTLMIEYHTPGYTGPVELKPVKQVDRTWVMR